MFLLILHQPRALLTLPSLYAVISKHLIASFHEGRGRRRKKEERGLEGKKEEKREERTTFRVPTDFMAALLISLRLPTFLSADDPEITGLLTSSPHPPFIQRRHHHLCLETPQ